MHRFPGCQPVSIENSHIKNLSNDKYFVCEKTDGVRYMFACLVHKNKPYSVLFDRNLNMFLLKTQVQHKLYEGTLLDGELVQHNDNSYHYYIFDVLLHNGKNVMNETLLERLTCAHSICDNIRFCHHFTLHVKDFLKLNEFDKTKEYPYKTDGLIFTPIHEPIKFGTNYSLYKWKDGFENTVDFYIDERFQMFLSNNNQLSLTKETIFDEDLLNVHFNFPCIVECKYRSFRTWNMIKERKDKDRPNSVYTFTKTLKNIHENIQLNDLFNHL